MNLDRQAWLDCVDGDQELLSEVAGLFLSRYPAMRATLGQKLAEGDAAALAREAHTLRGSLSNFPAAAACWALERLEALARQGALYDAEERLTDLDREMIAVLAAMREWAQAQAA